jgi:putative CocE/NonD family hydrolase
MDTRRRAKKIILSTFAKLIIPFTLLLSTNTSALGEKSWSQYITMPDGVRLAIDVWLPENVSKQQALPTIIYSTRYWRGKDYEPEQAEPNRAIQFFNQAGYAVIIGDVRGTGASFGSRQDEFSVAETRDYYHVIDWIIKQPWSNQRVASTGVSYTANTAEHSVFSNHPALKVANPRFSDFDWYTSLVFPGGVPNKIISSGWGGYVWSLDMNDAAALNDPNADGPKLLGVKPVDSDNNKVLLKQAVAEHKHNSNVSTTLAKVVYRDDKKEALSLNDAGDFFVTPYRFKHAVEQSDTVLFHWGSWLDSGTAAGILSRFASYDAQGDYIIGPWNHGAYKDANPFAPADRAVSPTTTAQYQQIVAYFAPYMLASAEQRPAKENYNKESSGKARSVKATITKVSNAKQKTKQLKYFTMGEDVWKTTSVWPPLNSHYQKLFLASNNRLANSAPTAVTGVDDYQVNFEVGTGTQTRWSTQLTRSDVYYGDRAQADKLLLTYTAEPLTSAMEITGTPVVSVALASSHKDGVIIAYLESVAPDGKVTMLTEGELRLIHRKVSTEKPPYPNFGPYHSFLRKDSQAMIPDKMETVTFSLLPTSVLIPEGHSIRIAFAGHDKDSFERIPKQGEAKLSVGRDASHVSFIRLPIIARE